MRPGETLLDALGWHSSGTSWQFCAVTAPYPVAPAENKLAVAAFWNNE